MWPLQILISWILVMNLLILNWQTTYSLPTDLIWFPSDNLSFLCLVHSNRTCSTVFGFLQLLHKSRFEVLCAVTLFMRAWLSFNRLTDFEWIRLNFHLLALLLQQCQQTLAFKQNSPIKYWQYSVVYFQAFKSALRFAQFIHWYSLCCTYVNKQTLRCAC